MTSTIETNHHTILKKITNLKDICIFFTNKHLNIHESHAEKFNAEKSHVNQLKCIENKINEIYNSYTLNSVSILSDYFLFINKSKTNDLILIDKKKEYFNRFNRYIKSSNIIFKLDKIYAELYLIYDNIFFKNNNIQNPDLIDNNTKLLYKECWKLFSNYKKLKIHTHIEEVTISNLCKYCNKIMLITEVNEQSCIKCGKCTEITIIVSDEDNLCDTGQVKYGTYDPSKHCKYWLDRIQAHEIIDMTDIYAIVDNIKTKLEYDKIKNIDYINYKLIRKYLRKINKSNYNEHIPLIRKLITGVSPPQLTESELQKINVLFIKVIKLYNSVKPTSKINCPYHPYIIYKILEQILPDSNRKYLIMACIHLQSSQTLIQNDKIWKKICDHIEEFTYIPTDRNK